MENFCQNKESLNCPKVSVIVPIFNCVNYLKPCIESVLCQSIIDIEVIVIDDCSTDCDYKKLLGSYNDTRIRFVRNLTRIGAGPSRNKGIFLSRGDYISFLDGDDFYPNKDSLSLLYEKAIEDNLYICGGSLYIIDENSSITNQEVPGQFFTHSGLIKYRDYQHDGGFYRFIYKRNFLLANKIYFPNLRRMQDPVFFVNAMIKAKSFYAFQEYVYAYRKGHKTIVWTQENILDHYKAIRKITNISKDYNLSHLHYLMVKNFFHFSLKYLKKVSPMRLQVGLVLSFVNSVDFHLLANKRKDEVECFNAMKLLSVILLTHIYP